MLNVRFEKDRSEIGKLFQTILLTSIEFSALCIIRTTTESASRQFYEVLNSAQIPP